MTAKTPAERQQAFRQRLTDTPEVRGVFAHPDDHAPIKAEAVKIARRRERATRKAQGAPALATGLPADEMAALAQGFKPAL